MTYSNKIKTLREVMLISQSELAELLGISFVTVNRWENDKYEPTIKIKRKLNELFIKHNIDKYEGMIVINKARKNRLSGKFNYVKERKYMRDDFTKKTIQILCTRAGNQCSNPNCNQITQGPDNKSNCINIGVASHISAASQGGPRYNSNITSDERKDIKNGIWLCQNCAKLIDSDPEYYTCELLEIWKESHEKFIAYELAHPLNSNITDKQLIEFFLMCFTRPAFTHPIVQEGNNEDLYRAICDTIVALNTGKLYSRDGRIIENQKGINYIKSSTLKQEMYNIRDILSTIKDRMETEIKENRFFSREGYYCFDYKTTQYFYYEARNEILLIINNLANAFGIKSDLSIKDRHRYNRIY